MMNIKLTFLGWNLQKQEISLEILVNEINFSSHCTSCNPERMWKHKLNFSFISSVNFFIKIIHHKVHSTLSLNYARTARNARQLRCRRRVASSIWEKVIFSLSHDFYNINSVVDAWLLVFNHVESVVNAFSLLF